MKICKSCKIEKSLDQFYKKKGSKDGLFYVCKACEKQRLISWRRDNPERRKIQDKNSNEKRYREDPKKVLDKQLELKKRNPEKYKQIHRRANKKYRLKNLSYFTAKQNKRRANKLKATPCWLNQEQLVMLNLIYKNCPKGHHVDHIIPLKGKRVSGLHVPWNLQYLSAIENIKKGNRFEGDLSRT